MTDDIYNDTAIEKFSLDHFKKKLDIKQVIVRNVPASTTSSATLFLATDNKVYLYIEAEGPMILDDVRKIVMRMGLEADDFLPPAGDSEYFDTIGITRFKTTFPGRQVESENDIRFYKLLAPYNPALVQISAIKTGEVKQFDLDSKGWRLAARYSYRKVRPTS